MLEMGSAAQVLYIRLVLRSAYETCAHKKRHLKYMTFVDEGVKFDSKKTHQRSRILNTLLSFSFKQSSHCNYYYTRLLLVFKPYY